MDSKRKASAASAHDAVPDTPDRAAKRRKIMEEYNELANGETPDSTTALGLNFLEQVRATTDKNGRPVSAYFEKLPSRAQNPGYYKKIRLPLSLESIEQKLQNRQYPTLSTLESDLKRLVTNAKETTDRSSLAFADAERVRKAVSNLMTKCNPAYKTPGYQAIPTPLPPTPESDAGQDADADGEADVDTKGSKATDTEPASQGDDDGAEDEEDDQGQEEDEENESGGYKKPTSARRRASSRAKPSPQPRQASTPGARKEVRRTGKADHYFENIPFKDLNFQQAQEKLVEELIRRKEEPGSDFAYFESFLFLPSRSLKDYYEVIAEPMSLKALQKQVRGQLGRGEATYVSVYKTWAAFEDTASLIWKNAYHYNEDGSEIFSLAQELEELFHDFLKEAKANVPEPQQPKIKLKLPAAAETPSMPHPKKLIIHVGGKSSAAGSPAPPTARSGEGEATRNSIPTGRNPFSGSTSTAGPLNVSQLEKARSMSASAGPPSPSPLTVAKAEQAAQPTPAARPQPTPTTFHHFAPVGMPAATPTTNGNGVFHQLVVAPPSLPPPPPSVPKLSAADILELRKYRPRSIQPDEAIMPKLIIVSHPQIQVENPLTATIKASPTEYQQEVVLSAPSTHFRLQLKPHIAAFLETQQREWKLNVLLDGQRLYPSQTPLDKRHEPAFDAQLRYGINRIEVTVVSALPKGEVGLDGLNMELERIVVHFNLLRH